MATLANGALRSTTLHGLPFTSFTSQSPINFAFEDVVGSDGGHIGFVFPSMERSSKARVSASFASFNTGFPTCRDHRAIKDPHPPLYATKERTALIWFSCFLLTISNFQRNSAFSASLFATLVSAARQPDSDPTCENPRTVNGAANAMDDYGCRDCRDYK